MNKLLASGALLSLLGSCFSATASDTAETKGGIVVKSDDGRFEAKLGGGIYFDGNLVSEDDGAAFGSPENPAQSGFFFRRIFVTFAGRLHGWNYKVEPDFAPDNSTGKTDIAFQDVYFATKLGQGEVQIGQRKPFRAMEDLTSSNDILMIERPFASSSGVFAGGQSREFANGIFYHGNYDYWTWGIGGYSLRGINTPGTEGVGASIRTTYAPLAEAGRTLHLGLSVTHENPANNQGAVPSTTPINIGTAVSYAGRRGPTAVIGLTTGSEPATTVGTELAFAFGPFFAQAEFMLQNLQQADPTPEQQVLAYYVQGSVFLTGETKPYNKKEGVFRSPRPNAAGGALELTARYEEASNQDDATASGGCVGSPTVDRCEARAATLGANYYANPSVRFMLNYTVGEQDRGSAGKDRPTALAARFQLVF